MIYREADIDQARKEFKTGADLADLTKALLELGIEHYDYRIQDGTYSYFGTNGYVLDYATKPAEFGQIRAADESQVNAISTNYLTGNSDFSDFILQLAHVGVSLITVNLKQRKVDYSGKTGVILGSATY